MKKILLSADSLSRVCLVPDVVADNLFEYIDDFYDHLEQFKLIKLDDGHYMFTENEIEGFIHWLNRMFKEESSIVEIIEDSELVNYKDTPSWNF